MRHDTPREWLEHDYYAVLGVPPSASRDEIGRAYRRLARAAHPDVDLGNPAATERFELISAAKATLSDPRTRAAYDEARRASRRTARRPPEPTSRVTFDTPAPASQPSRRRTRIQGYARPGPAVWIPDRPERRGGRPW